MRSIGDGVYECQYCGARLHLGDGAGLRATMHAASGQPNVRVINVGRREVHRCAIPDTLEFDGSPFVPPAEGMDLAGAG